MSLDVRKALTLTEWPCAKCGAITPLDCDTCGGCVECCSVLRMFSKIDAEVAERELARHYSDIGGEA